MPRKLREIPWLHSRDDVYYVGWHDPVTGRTKRTSLRTADSVEAQKRYAAFLTQGHAIFADAGRASSLSVTQALDDYYREHVAHHVIDKGRQEDAINHLKAWFKDTPISDIDIPASRGYADARRTGVIGGGTRRHSSEGSDSTIRRELVVLGAAARHAARWKRIGPSAQPPAPMPSIELPAENRQEAQYLTASEFDRATEKATGALKDYVLVSYYTAGRRKSVERLTRFQVDLKHSRINLRGTDEDGNRRRSKKRRPVVPIDPALRPVLERLLAESTTEWLFGTPRDFYRVFNEHMVTLGFPTGKCHPHILRHSRATHLLQSGVPLYDVARLLGDTVATVERVYGHHHPDYLAESIRRRTE